MNTKLYALLVIVACTVAGVQPSEENKTYKPLSYQFEDGSMVVQSAPSFCAQDFEKAMDIKTKNNIACSQIRQEKCAIHPNCLCFTPYTFFPVSPSRVAKSKASTTQTSQTDHQ